MCETPCDLSGSTDSAAEHHRASTHGGSLRDPSVPIQTLAIGCDNVPAEGKGLMENRLGVAYVQASPEGQIELCLSRSGGLPPAGESNVTDDNDARTARSSKGVPGESGWQQPTDLRITSNWGYAGNTGITKPGRNH